MIAETLALSLLLDPTTPSGKYLIDDGCPTSALATPIAEPAKWADECFARTTGRAPNEERGERATAQRDLDLDGIDEHLEIRGTGQSSKNIYVFKAANNDFYYLGLLKAHPSFDIRRNSDDTIEYVYFHGLGLNDGIEVVFRYIDDQFKVARRSPVRLTK